MKDFFVFGMGFASGWAARTNADSLREMAVNLIASGYRGADRLRTKVETEREFLQDLVAEGRAHYEAHLKTTETETVSEEPVPNSPTEQRIRAA
jgi:hypothetical protein